MRGVNPAKKYVNLGKITTPFGGSTTQEGFHPGVDVANSLGTPIHAPVDGTIIRTNEGHVTGENSFGNQVELKDNNGNLHQFNHLQKALAKSGQKIRKGETIATLGNSGAVYSKSGLGDGANLDYRIVNSYNQYVNPTQYAQHL